MSIAELTSREAVLAAVAEFDHLGRDAFLAKYGYGRARRYFLERNERHYDSKAIVGAAYGFQFPARGALHRRNVRGGERTVKAKLEDLGFAVRVLSSHLSPR